MINPTNDQYIALSELDKWYKKYKHQFIEIAGIINTGIDEVVKEFIDQSEFDSREVMYLSYDQKQVLEMAYVGYHAYYLDAIVYKYICITDINTLPLINYQSPKVVFQWKRQIRNKINKRYKLIVILDSVLLSANTLKDIGEFGLPVILVRDPLLIPSPDSYTFIREPNIILRETKSISSPINYFTHKLILGESLEPGVYDNVTILPRNQMNMLTLKTSDMIITLSDKLAIVLNQLYRERIIRPKNNTNVTGERLIVVEPLHRERLINSDNSAIKLYLTKGLVGTLSKINRHAPTTRYVSVDFQPDGYHESFVDLPMDRYVLNNITANSKQSSPEEPFIVDYAYALSAVNARYSHWDKVTIIIDQLDIDIELYTRLVYTAVTRASKSLTIVT